jgi:hypothetical protein
MRDFAPGTTLPSGFRTERGPSTGLFLLGGAFASAERSVVAESSRAVADASDAYS